MRIGGGIERWMILLPIAAILCVVVLGGGTREVIDTLDRLLAVAWHALEGLVAG